MESKAQNSGFKAAARCGIASAFTLIELLVSMTILTFIVLIITGLANAASQAWVRGNQSSEVYQNGRAILDLISRDLRQAVISPKLQFIQSPSLGSAGQLKYSSNIFWQANIGSTSKGSLCEVGYYLTDQCELKRFFVPPDDTNNYAIFNSNPANTDAPYPLIAPWVTNYLANANTSNQPLATTVSNGVLGFWVRCLDVNGDPVPYIVQNGQKITNVKYDSANSFQPATPGVHVSPVDSAQGPSSLKHTTNGTTAAANLLPSAVELYVLTVDKATYDRVKPQLLADTNGQQSVIVNATSGDPPVGIPGNAVGHQAYLQAPPFNIRTSKVFYSRAQVGTN